MENVDFPQQFTEDVKIEQSAKGARVTVHVFGNSPDDDSTLQRAITLYKMSMETLKAEGIAVAPIEVKEK